MQKFKSVTIHNWRYVWQLTVLGRPLRNPQHFDDPEDAALDCDLVKHYLRTEFKLDLPASLDGEQFSALAYSRRGVNLSDSLSVLKSLPDCVQIFLTEQKAELCAYRNAAPPETTASKFRRSGLIEILGVKQWVEQLEAAEDDAKAFSAIDSDSFFLRLKVVAASFETVLKSLRLAVKMHAGVTNPPLVKRQLTLIGLAVHVEQNLDYVKHLTADLRAEQAAVESAVATLEANRPNLS